MSKLFKEVDKDYVPPRSIAHLGKFNDDEDYSQYSNEADQEAYEPTEVTIARLLKGERVGSSSKQIYEIDLNKQSIDDALKMGMDPTRETGFDLSDVPMILKRAEGARNRILDSREKAIKESEYKEKETKVPDSKETPTTSK